MNHQDKIRWVADLLREESTLTLATVDGEGLPASAPVFYLPGEDLSLWWLSSAKSLHSQNLLRQPQVALSVYRSVHNWKEIRGAQMRGRVEVVEDAARRKPVLERYCQHFELGTVFQVAILRSTLYCFRPEWIRAIDNSRRFGWGFELTLTQN